jgi:methyl-accepting chemotaxis protein
MTPPRKKSNGPTWEDVHNELKVLATKDELNQLGDRLGKQLMSLDLRFESFTQLVGDSTRQTATLTAQLAADSKSQRASMDDQATKLDVLRTDLTDFELESARGDKRVGIIAATLAFIGSVIAAALGTRQ